MRITISSNNVKFDFEMTSDEALAIMSRLAIAGARLIESLDEDETSDADKQFADILMMMFGGRQKSRWYHAKCIETFSLRDLRGITADVLGDKAEATCWLNDTTKVTVFKPTTPVYNYVLYDVNGNLKESLMLDYTDSESYVMKSTRHGSIAERPDVQLHRDEHLPVIVDFVSALGNTFINKLNNR